MLSSTSATSDRLHPPSPVATARQLRALLSGHAERCERERKITPEVMQALRDSGLFKMMFPRRAGGVGNTLICHIETIAELAKGCPSTAWAFSLLSGVTASAASLPPAIAQHIFRNGDELVCSVAGQTGTATLVDGGYEINGSWGYASGCLHADWAMNGVQILDAHGQAIDAGFAIIPLHVPEVCIKDTWHVSGVAGSGSNTIVATGLRIAQQQVLRYSQLRQGNDANNSLLEPRDRWPVEPLFPLGVLAPMLGAAESMFEQVHDGMSRRKVIGWQYAEQSASQVLINQLGEARMEVDSAWLHIRRAAAQIDETAQQGPLSGFEKARIQADCGYAMGLLRRAGERLMDIAGPGGFATSNPLQRFWRDLSMGSRHTALNTRLSLELYGRALCGLDSSLQLLTDIRP